MELDGKTLDVAGWLETITPETFGRLELSDRNQARHDIIRKVWDFFETVDFWKLGPRQDLVDNGFCLAKPGAEYLIYRQSRGSGNVKITGGPYKVIWINGQNTWDRRDGGTISNGKDLNTPNSGDDWLLHLTKKGANGDGLSPGGVTERGL